MPPYGEAIGQGPKSTTSVQNVMNKLLGKIFNTLSQGQGSALKEMKGLNDSATQ